MPTSDAGQRAEARVGPGPVPEDVDAAARAAYLCRWTEAGVATLVFDSVLAGVPGPGRGRYGGARRLVFRGEGLTVEVDVAPDRSAVGRLVPPRATDVVLCWPGGSYPVRSDDQGCFALGQVPRGPATLRFPSRTGAGEAPVGTEWVVF